MSKSRPKERKPLSFSTTMRSPERIYGFLRVIQKYDGQELTGEIINNIIKEIIKCKLYSTMYQKANTKLKEIYNDPTLSYTQEQVQDIIDNSPQNHKEAGFAKGWESRFDTWYKLIKELGFVYYKLNEKIEISEIGKQLCEIYQSEDEAFDQKLRDIFLNVFCKYRTNNPFRRNANETTPLVLLANLLSLMKQEDQNSAGISKKEIPFLLCWRNNNHEALYRFIKSFRKKYGFKASEEKIYRYCLRFLASSNKTRFKMTQILVEGVDDFVRKMRITGLFSLRGMGRFLDLNSFQSEKIKYIIQHYSNQKEYTSEKEYFSYIGAIDSNLLETQDNYSEKDIGDIKIKALERFSKQYQFETICEELKKLQSGKASADTLMRDIERPTRFEFLTSIALKQCFPHATIYPNYTIDDEGIPTFTAKGGIADIEFYDQTNEVLVEVTLLNGAVQGKNEIPAITRHLLDLKTKSTNNKNKFSIFVAPSIHFDAQYMCDFSLEKYKIKISPLSISAFIQKLEQKKVIEEF